MIDWNYDGVVMQPTVMDVPDKKEMVTGVYDIPDDAGTIKVKLPICSPNPSKWRCKSLWQRNKNRHL